MDKGNSLLNIKELEKYKDPTVTEVIQLSKKLNIDLEVLAKFFLEKAESELKE